MLAVFADSKDVLLGHFVTLGSKKYVRLAVGESFSCEETLSCLPGLLQNPT